VTLLQTVGGGTVRAAVGMIRVGLPTVSEGGLIVPIAKIEGIAHLIPLEPEESWLVNNRIDLETWNAIYD